MLQHRSAQRLACERDMASLSIIRMLLLKRSSCFHRSEPFRNRTCNAVVGIDSWSKDVCSQRRGSCCYTRGSRSKTSGVWGNKLLSFSVAPCTGSLPRSRHRATKLCFLQRFELRQVAAELLRRQACLCDMHIGLWPCAGTLYSLTSEGCCGNRSVYAFARQGRPHRCDGMYESAKGTAAGCCNNAHVFTYGEEFLGGILAWRL